MAIKKALELLKLLFEWPWSGERAEMKRARQVSLNEMALA
jgi:hypothetical protein